MAVFRVEKTKNYTVMSNYHLKEKGLSLKAKGLLSVVLSLPEGWDYSIRGLAAISKEGVDGIGAALKELERAGYLARNRLRDDKGRISGTEYVIYEFPQRDLPDTEKPYMATADTVTPDAGLPDTGSAAQLKTNLTKNQEVRTFGLSTHQSIRADFGGDSVNHEKHEKHEHTDKIDTKDSHSVYLEIIRENIDYDDLCEQHKHHVREIDEIVGLMVEAVCSARKSIRIGGEDKPAAVVKSRMLKLDFTHIEYVLECLGKNTTNIRNIKSYLLTTIYNSVDTIGSYYRAAVNHDFYGG